MTLKTSMSALTRQIAPLAFETAKRPNAVSQLAVASVRFASKKAQNAKTAVSAAPENKLDAKTLALQRERIALRAKAKREEARKEAKLRMEAREAKASALCMDIETALRYLRAAEVGNRPSSTTISLNMRIVAEKGATPVNGNCRLPKPLDTERICVFTNSSELAQQARKAGAAVVGGDEIIEQVRNGVVNFDRAYATPDIAKKLTSIARILGPKGLMPNAKRGTVTEDIFNAVSSAVGETTFKQHGNMLRLSVARASFTDLEAVRNIVAVINSVRDNIANSGNTKNAYIGKTTITSTHGPAIVIEV